MKKNSKTSVRNTASAVAVAAAQPQAAVDGGAPVIAPYHSVLGLDVGDRQGHYCVLDLKGGVVAEGAVKTTESGLRMLFEGKGRMRIALEAGTHSPWISRLLSALGHEVLVANPRKLRLIAESDAKHDRADAQLLARLAHVGPALFVVRGIVEVWRPRPDADSPAEALGFGRFAARQCRAFYGEVTGGGRVCRRANISKCRFVGYFEGIDAEPGIICRAG